MRYVLNDGRSLPGVEDESIDGLWSFDAFVHIAPMDVASYLREIGRVLRPGSRAVIHHSGAGKPVPSGWRSPMTRKLFANLATEAGFEVDSQFTPGPVASTRRGLWRRDDDHALAGNRGGGRSLGSPSTRGLVVDQLEAPGLGRRRGG